MGLKKTKKDVCKVLTGTLYDWNHFIDDVTEISKEFNIKLKLDDTCMGAGAADTKKRIIYLNNFFLIRKPLNCLYSVFFHELCHVLCLDNKKYFKYHTITHKLRLTKNDRIIMIKTGLKAERYVDKLAKKLMNFAKPNLIFEPGYEGKKARSWYHENYLSAYREDEYYE